NAGTRSRIDGRDADLVRTGQATGPGVGRRPQTASGGRIARFDRTKTTSRKARRGQGSGKRYTEVYLSGRAMREAPADAVNLVRFCLPSRARRAPIFGSPCLGNGCAADQLAAPAALAMGPLPNSTCLAKMTRMSSSDIRWA